MSLWFRSDWVNPLRPEKYNWIDFSIVHASVELDRRFGNFEFHAALLGLHVGGSFDVGAGDEELQASLKTMMSEIDSGDAMIGISLKEYNELREKAGVLGGAE